MAVPPFPLPKEGATGEEVLRSFGTHFKWADEVTTALLKSHIEGLEEFRFFFDGEDKIEPFISKLNLGETKSIQAARLRRAWAAVRLFYAQAEQDRSKVPVADLDTMLAEGELRNVKLLFWRRYKLRFPAEVHPSDATVSRVAREMDKRMLCVFNLWKVKSLQFQLHCTQKKRKLGDGLFTEEVDEEEPSSHSAEAYLDRLHTLLLAYALAGSGPVTGGPAGADEANLGADSTRFVMVPLDIVMAYHLRAKRTSSQVAPTRRLSWLQSRDAEERAEWVSRFRESTSTLGQVIKEVYSARDAHWIPTQATVGPEQVPAAGPGNPTAPTTPAASSQFALGKPVNGRKVAKTMKDGTKLCASFQQGHCKAKTQCPGGGAHRCGVVIRGERVCGAPSHGASTCRQQVKP